MPKRSRPAITLTRSSRPAGTRASPPRMRTVRRLPATVSVTAPAAAKRRAGGDVPLRHGRRVGEPHQRGARPARDGRGERCRGDDPERTRAQPVAARADGEAVGARRRRQRRLPQCAVGPRLPGAEARRPDEGRAAVVDAPQDAQPKVGVDRLPAPSGAALDADEGRVERPVGARRPAAPAEHRVAEPRGGPRAGPARGRARPRTGRPAPSGAGRGSGRTGTAPAPAGPAPAGRRDRPATWSGTGRWRGRRRWSRPRSAARRTPRAS